MDKQLEQLQQTQNTLVKACTVLKYVLYAFFGLYCLMLGVVLAYMIILPEGFSLVGTAQPTMVASVLCDAVAGGLVLLTMGLIVGCVSKGASPFTVRNSRLLIALGCLVTISVVCKLFIVPGLDVGAVSDSNSMVFTAAAPQDGTIFIDARGILEAVACFVLAAIFRYGSLLQKETDDMV